MRFAFLAFLSVLSTLLAIAHYYLHWRLVAQPQWPEPWLAALTAATWASAVATPFGLALGRVLRNGLGRAVAFVSYAWFGMLGLLLMFALLSEPLRLLARLWLPELASARAFGAAIAATVLVGFVAGLISANKAVGVRRLDVRLQRLDASNEGFKLVQLSDVHIGPTLRKEWLQRIVNRVNELQADAIAITGDLVDGSVDQLREHVAPLAQLQARFGVFFVTGNHEYYSGADAWIEHLASLDVRTLRNERLRIGDGDGFDLAGVDDWTAFGKGHGRDLKKALADRDPSREVVLLAHQPRQIREAAELDVGLQLSGHTHGGQIFPFHLFVPLQQPFRAGLDRLGSTQLYTSRGTGYWGPPLRLLAPAEITLLTLRQASS
jgi:uncharacterized protein